MFFAPEFESGLEPLSTTANCVNTMLLGETVSSDDDESVETTFSLQLISHISTVTKTGKRSKTHLKKETTTKEMKFTCIDSNYLAFLRAILDKYSLKYKITDSKQYKFKYYYPGRS